MNLIKQEITKLSVPIGPFVYPIKSSVLPEEGARETNQKKKENSLKRSRMNINQIQEFTEEYIVDSTPKACFQIYDWLLYSEPFPDWLVG